MKLGQNFWQLGVSNFNINLLSLKRNFHLYVGLSVLSINRLRLDFNLANELESLVGRKNYASLDSQMGHGDEQTDNRFLAVPQGEIIVKGDRSHLFIG